MVTNGDITVQDIIKHYENHLSVVKIKELVQSMPSIDPFEYTHTTVDKKTKIHRKNETKIITCTTTNNMYKQEY